MFRKRPIHPLIQLLVTLSLLLVPLITALPVAAGGPVELWIASMADSPDPVLAGQTLTYSFELRSSVSTGSSLENVQLHVFLPPYVTPVDSDESFSVLPDGRVVFDFGSYPDDYDWQDDIWLKVLVQDDAVALEGAPFTMLATAWLTSDNPNMYAGTVNQDYETTDVEDEAVLHVTKVRMTDLVPNFIIAGQTILYEVTSIACLRGCPSRAMTSSTLPRSSRRTNWCPSF